MKSKKFVLAALALLAITGLLALAGCKNDSVPETPAAKLVSITVTPPTRTVYSVGQSFDPTGMVVTATYNAGEPKDVTSLAKTDFDFSSAGVQTVTVNYTEGETPKTTTFTVTVFPAEVKVLAGYTSPNNTDDSWTYVAFGEWPQTIKADSVFVGESEGKQMGMFTYYLGEDSNYYVKHSDKYYKVEPIVWRVLTTSYKAPEGGTAGNALLLAESILTGIPYYHFDWEEGGLDGKEWSGPRIIEGKTIHPNNYEHSQIRAWLNGLSYESKESEGATQSSKDEYKNAGFLQTAFTADAQSLIADTTVDNSAASTIPSGITDEDLELDWKSGENQYASDTPTKDKIFLLSQQEATNSEYGFGAYSEEDSTRIRVTTDYAKATGAYLGDSTAGYGGVWWLRSPSYYYEGGACGINFDGDAYNAYSNYHVCNSNVGVVPALSISLQ